MSLSPSICIAGGGAVGLSLALRLILTQGVKPEKITICELDSFFTRNSASLSAGGVRTAFTVPENVAAGREGLEYYRDGGWAKDIVGVEEKFGVRGEQDYSFYKSSLQFQPYGYMFLTSTPHGLTSLLSTSSIRQSLSLPPSTIHTPDQLKSSYPYLNTSDLVGGSVTSGDGWFDPYTYLTTSYATLKKAGVNMKGGVKGVETDGETGRVKKVHTEEGEGVECEFFVNASGAGGGDVVDMVTGGGELEYPVKPRKRTVFHFHANKITTGDGGNVVPLTVDTTGVWFRGVGEVGGGGGEFLAGCTPPIDPDRDYRVDGLEPESGLWNDGVWEKLYERVEEFGDVKVKNEWGGFYEYNTADQNGIIGFHPLHPNFLILNGFSGHGLQQAPSVGKAGAELIVEGGFWRDSIDWGRFGMERFEGGKLVFEEGIV